MTGTPYIAVAAGGTGGHMMPADAMSHALRETGADVTLITDKRGAAYPGIMEDFDRHVLNIDSHMGGGIWSKMKAFISLGFATLNVRRLFKAKRPDCVVGFGGYPSLPALLAARALRIPYVLHEQNAVLGKVNRWMGKGAAGIALSLPATKRVPTDAATAVTGNPVRRIIEKIANIAYSVPMGAGDIRIFILGGSQGARILSNVVPAALAQMDDSIRERLIVSHQARREDRDRVHEIYQQAGIRAEVQPYYEDVAAILLRTQLVISRAGASTLAELTAMGRPAILVPLAIAADDHQRINASVLQGAGGAWVMQEADFTPDSLAALLDDLFADMGDMRKASDNMRACAALGAADHLAELVLGVTAGQAGGADRIEEKPKGENL